jgi:broad specificity phosphatase PhoE
MIIPTKVERLFIVRHGESIANVDPSVYRHTAEYEFGIPDEKVWLTPVGWEQALACGRFLNAYLEPDQDVGERRIAIWYSSFLRARQTAKGIFTALEPKISHVYERDTMVEVSFGYADGLPESEVQKKFPEYWAQLKRAEAFRTKHFLASPNGESRASVASRVDLFIASLQRKTEEHGITDHIVVTHGATARLIAKQWLGHRYEITDASRNLNNCDVVMIAKDPENSGYLDYGRIYEKGVPKANVPVRYDTAFDRLHSAEFTPSFARGPGG